MYCLGGAEACDAGSPPPHRHLSFRPVCARLSLSPWATYIHHPPNPSSSARARNDQQTPLFPSLPFRQRQDGDGCNGNWTLVQGGKDEIKKTSPPPPALPDKLKKKVDVLV
ncbi:hypothetical protein IF1G_09447 [Cordyceps javanica]|uniref:Uncharacterized protein n=1 Tax=Cordyceps javanica TaxID=43265 RepID=A0A545UQW9_9HYPO|nr:hypothetical protein IF1G_09447 [Cordyceps javanica]